MPLRNMPMGSLIHCVELSPVKGRSWCEVLRTSCQLIAKEGGYVTLRMRSGEMRKILADCRATLGEVG